MKDIQKKFVYYKDFVPGEIFSLKGWPSVKIRFNDHVKIKFIVKIGFFCIAKFNIDGHKCTLCFFD